MPFIHFSEQEKAAANTADIVSFLKSKGEEVKRIGHEYAWNSPTGKVSIDGSQWFSQYELVGGGAVAFVQKFFNLSYPDTVRTLLGYSAGTEIVREPKIKKQKDEQPLELPEKYTDMKRLYAYLLGERYIDRDVLLEFIHRELIYEDAEYHNAVFVGLDENGVPKHIQKRSTHSVSSYKGNIEGSNAEYSFNFVGNSDKLYVFEAPIDMLAYISIFRGDWQQHSYVALCSTANVAALRMLRSYPNIKQVYLCLDHDPAGIEGSYRVAESIHQLGEYNVWRILPKNKDWDEDLKALRGKEPIPASEHPKLEHIRTLCCEFSSICWEEDPSYKAFKTAKGLAVSIAMDRLKTFLNRLELSENDTEIQHILLDMAKTTVIAVKIRDAQLNNEREFTMLIEQMKSKYKPHKDNDSSESQTTELKKYFQELSKQLSSNCAFTRSECLKQNEMFLELGIKALMLHGCIERRQSQDDSLTLDM